jgi:hypothetical protein
MLASHREPSGNRLSAMVRRHIRDGSLFRENEGGAVRHYSSLASRAMSGALGFLGVSAALRYQPNRGHRPSATS